MNQHRATPLATMNLPRREDRAWPVGSRNGAPDLMPTGLSPAGRYGECSDPFHACQRAFFLEVPNETEEASRIRHGADEINGGSATSTTQACTTSYQTHSEAAEMHMAARRMKVPLYVYALPNRIPKRMVLVHNRVILGITPSRRPGSRGFRAWLSPKGTKGLVACGCGWAPKLGQHFRPGSSVPTKPPRRAQPRPHEGDPFGKPMRPRASEGNSPIRSTTSHG